jgi:hypothetical protein
MQITHSLHISNRPARKWSVASIVDPDDYAVSYDSDDESQQEFELRPGRLEVRAEYLKSSCVNLST